MNKQYKTIHFHPKLNTPNQNTENKTHRTQKILKRQKTKQANNWEQRTKQLGKNLEAYIPTPSNKSFTHVLKQSIFREYLRLRCFQPLSSSA